MLQIGFPEILLIIFLAIFLVKKEQWPDLFKFFIQTSTNLRKQFDNISSDLKDEINADEIIQDVFNENRMKEIEKNDKQK
ncbi:MAG: hypothetical protein VX139_04470 [Pseudomonadota bacterium]|nr:hypothetical protein [Pseudomonadota bacterium]MEC8000502.1 hypothetical protein [Pseudomonadota bacterium]